MCVALAWLVLCGLLAAQTPAAPKTLTVAGDVTTPLSLTLEQVRALPRAKVTVQEQGRPVVYEGVAMAELLKRAGVPMGAGMSGAALAAYVKATAADGYEVVYSIGELDPGIGDSDALVADLVDGQPLFDYQGPFRLLMPHDKRGARSVRMLTRLDVVNLKKK